MSAQTVYADLVRATLSRRLRKSVAAKLDATSLCLACHTQLSAACMSATDAVNAEIQNFDGNNGKDEQALSAVENTAVCTECC
jgi:hypothetical protein